VKAGNAWPLLCRRIGTILNGPEFQVDIGLSVALVSITVRQWMARKTILTMTPAMARAR
jgi:hypothetical protein